ncbi:MAG TPA: inorganic phosphate transporter [Candidatus Acetothermia bacterium]|nr:inorganic phosphate transporter [Candidatus Acetothermia bacterium]
MIERGGEMWTLIAGGFMGWALGANDAANLIGPAVESRALRFWTAAVIASGFVVLGAVMVGSRGFATYGAIGTQTLVSSFIVMLSAGITVAGMTFLGLPVSGTQAVVGAIIGAGLVSGGVNVAPLIKIFVSWVLTPLGGLVAAYIPYKLITLYPGHGISRLATHIRVVRIGLVLVTAYAAYSYGANNVANVTGVYVKAGLLSPLPAAIIGAATIALGILTFSRNVIRTVGSRLVALDPFAALVVVLGESITLNIYALLGVPVSASQAVVGAVVGIGLVKGARTINARALVRILFGWLGTPTIAAGLSLGLTLLIRAI